MLLVYLLLLAVVLSPMLAGSVVTEEVQTSEELRRHRADKQMKVYIFFVMVLFYIIKMYRLLDMPPSSLVLIIFFR